MSRRRRNRGRSINGIVLLNKACGLSSNAALQQVKKLYEANKAGHTGSLDPLATGVLPLCLGEATKVSQFLLDSDKRYQTKIKLGERTDSGDKTGTIIQSVADFSVSEADIEKELAAFRGEIEQLPPMHSALKVEGVPLYKMARKGIEIEREKRKVTVYEISLLNIAEDVIELEIACSKGTYIRTIADDLGQALGCGANIIELKRTQASVFREEDCKDIEALTELKMQGGLEFIDDQLIPMDQAIAELPEVNLPSLTASHLKNGQAVIVRHLPKEGLVRLYEEEQFIGIGCIDDDGKVAPRRLIVS
ncbi:MAG: tRNA pseudouridine(55) synthase TruB [Gammaproteobacteria bacterium]|nr:tRNA pseudouridine(55) synthase TruB [Gammaproteobacteria bacterium]